jgi:ribosomal protein L11 methylase PrmA
LRSILFKAGLDPEYWNVLVTALWECGTAGILEEQDGMRAFFTDADFPEDLIARHRDVIVDVRDEPAAAIQPAAGECDPILIGKRFFVLPPTSNVRTPDGRIRLAIDATTAFGTGRHESTQAVMEALETLPLENSAVLDVGCGSGILSLAASALGAARVLSCDVHPDAIRTAAAYVSGMLFQGTIDAVRDRSADIVIANISAGVIDALKPDLNRITRENGILLLAGFMADRVPGGFVPEQSFENNGWLCWLARPSDDQAGAGRQQARIREFTERWW